MRKTKYVHSNMNNSNFNSETQKCNKTFLSTSDTDCARLTFVTVTWIVARENVIKHANPLSILKNWKR